LVNTDTVSISDSDSEFLFVGNPTMAYENNAESSFYQDGDDQSLVEDDPDVVPEEDTHHQDYDTEDRRGDDDGDEDEGNHGKVEHGDDEHDNDGDDHDDDHDDQPSLTTTPTPPIPAPRR
jgi:hypothetical protein